ncbi:MAG: hypothetical protein EA351_15065 [Gemmatimonadales bacterium]|nr:MAG: hypothetical protein EA351_15065 [Gemmatimonadales bacterium]
MRVSVVGPEGPVRPATLSGRGAPTAVILVLALISIGCAPLGLGESESEILRIDGEYTGTLSIQGQQLFGSLTIDQEADHLELSFHFAEAGIQASGEGRVTPSGFSAEVPYAITCPGEATFEGVKDPRDRALSGNVSVSDCNGTSSGTFRFSPRR